jgi:hypothetical protein
MIFETQGRGQYPPKWLPYRGWAEADYQSGARPNCQKQPEWITFSALEWITFRALQTSTSVCTPTPCLPGSRKKSG